MLTRHRHGGCASRRYCRRSWAESTQSWRAFKFSAIHYLATWTPSLATSSRASHSACTTQTASLAWPGIPSSGSCFRGQDGFGLAMCLRASLGLAHVGKPMNSSAASMQLQRSARGPILLHQGDAPDYLVGVGDFQAFRPLGIHTDGLHSGQY